MFGGLVGCTARDSKERIDRQIATILSRSDADQNARSVRIQSLSGALTYYESNPNQELIPASTTKLFTTSAAFAKLGSTHRFQTEIYISGAITNGNLNGDIILVSEHDFTWSKHFYNNPRTPLDEMAKLCRGVGLRAVTGNVIAQGECLYEDKLSNERVASEFKNALVDSGINVSGHSVAKTGFSPSGQLYSSWKSIPLQESSKALNKESINLFANVLLRHIGWKIKGKNNAVAGAEVVFTWLESIGINTVGMVMEDGSGLSRNNRFSAGQTVRLLRHMHKNFPSFIDTLSIGCADGTLTDRFCETAAANTIYAKTGTLPGVVALSGYISNRLDGQVYVYSFIANSVKDREETRNVIDEAVLAITQTKMGNSGK